MQITLICFDLFCVKGQVVSAGASCMEDTKMRVACLMADSGADEQLWDINVHLVKDSDIKVERLIDIKVERLFGAKRTYENPEEPDNSKVPKFCMPMMPPPFIPRPYLDHSLPFSPAAPSPFPPHH